MSNVLKCLQAVGEPLLYVDDVFATSMYQGSGAVKTITTTVDLSTYGGLVWTYDRSGTYGPTLADTVRGNTSYLKTSDATAATTVVDRITSFNTNGYSLGANVQTNSATKTFVSWSFRKARRFFDIVSWTGNAGTGLISHRHNLGITPGMILIKAVNTTEGSWYMWHRSLGNTKYTIFPGTAAAVTAASPPAWDVDASQFSVNTTQLGMNVNGTSYIAYLFAHDPNTTDGIIQCGTYTGTSVIGNHIDLGWEPQFVMLRPTSVGGTPVVDTHRGMSRFYDEQCSPVYVNTVNAELTNYRYVAPTATGFDVSESSIVNFGANEYIYVAVRRSNKKPTVGTQVYSSDTSGSTTSRDVGFVPDVAISGTRTGVTAKYIGTRLRATTYLLPSSTAAKSGFSWNFKSVNTYHFSQGSIASTINYFFRRASGVCDVLYYIGTGVAKSERHNLNVVPELILLKRTEAVGDWKVYTQTEGATQYLCLNTTATPVTDSSVWNDTPPTATTFTVGTHSDVNDLNGEYDAYLFASLPGVSKVGTYVGNGSFQTIDCGFTTQARFILIKRTNSTGDWHVWDTTRGMNAGSDPHFTFNTTTAEVSTDDSIDVDSSGFIVNQDTATDINVTSATYIYLAFA